MGLSQKMIDVRFPDAEKVDVNSGIEAREEWVHSNANCDRMLAELNSTPLPFQMVAAYRSFLQEYGANFESGVYSSSSLGDLVREIGYLLWMYSRGKTETKIQQMYPFLYSTNLTEITRMVIDVEKLENDMESWIANTEVSDLVKVPSTSWKAIRVRVPMSFLGTLKNRMPVELGQAKTLLALGLFDYQALIDSIQKTGEHECIPSNEAKMAQ
jgi:hypothetical protein